MSQFQSESEFFPADSTWEDIARYGNVTLLHSGSYANIYRAQKAGKYFLLKSPKNGSSTYLNILKREYELSVGLDHPNITAAFTFDYVTEIGPCLVMEYVDGENLAEFLSHRPGVKSRKKILSQLLSAVGYLHKKNIIHNDLKPENIIISRQEENLKLIDFGLSDDDAHYLAKTLGCTPKYASPELLSGKGELDARSDIFSIGRLIKELFPIRYAKIWKRCIRTNPKARFGSTDSILNAIRGRRAINYILPIMVLLGAVSCFTLPEILQRAEYDKVVAESEAYFKQKCADEDIPADEVPMISMSAYFGTGQSREERSDSLHAIILDELADRIVRRNGIKALDSLYNACQDIIRHEPYNIFGTYDVVRFTEKYEATRDSLILILKKEKHQDEFYAFSRKRWEEYSAELNKMARALPDLGGLPTEQVLYYINLARSGKPYRPYKPVRQADTAGYH